jgi:hypothetical protein
MLLTMLCLLVISCGEKLPLPANVADDNGSLTDTTFVPVLPHWTEAGGIPFNYPFGVDIGYDQTIYISDTRNDRIVRLTPSGEFIESFSMPHPQGVAQDRGFTLAAVNGGNSVWLKRAGTADLSVFATLDSTYRMVVQPNGDTISWWDVPSFATITASRETKSVFFTCGAGRVRVMFGDIFQPKPELYSVTDSGAGYGSLYYPNDVEFAVVRNQRRLIVTQYGSLYGVQYLALPEYLPAIADSERDAFHMPLDDVKYVAADERGNVFVLHRANGLVMMFDKDGDFVLSFGRDGTDPLSLQDPTSIAVLGDMVLIADAKNNRISRYQMTAVPQN